MQTFTIPDDILPSAKDDINFIAYKTDNPQKKTKVFFTQNIITFLIDGEKEIFYSETPYKIKDKIAFIKVSNCLMTERKTASEKAYKALLVFFSDDALVAFKVKYQKLIKDICRHPAPAAIAVFNNDPYLIAFRESIMKGTELKPLSPELKKLKLEELLLYLLQNHTENFCRLLFQSAHDREVQFKSVVENNIFSHLSIDELAFLCHMSTATFKRHFKQYYCHSPQKWFIMKKMEYARALLEQNRQPSEIFSRFGYKSLSNFMRAYKKHFNRFHPQE